MKIGAIVEGHGDVAAVPHLLRRVVSSMSPELWIDVLSPLRVPRTKLVKDGELERAVEFIANKVGHGGRVLILVDADDDCPADLGPSLTARARAARADRTIEVVLAKFEYEAWFLASARSLAGQRGLPSDLEPPPDPESVRDAKRWLDERMRDGYQETIDQPALSTMFSLEQAMAARSFRKLHQSVQRLIA